MYRTVCLLTFHYELLMSLTNPGNITNGTVKIVIIFDLFVVIGAARISYVRHVSVKVGYLCLSNLFLSL